MGSDDVVSEDDPIPVTVVIPVKNEEANLAECLRNLGQFHSVVVVDSDSHDKTVEIARTYGAEILNFRWKGGFPKKRNWVLQTYEFQTPWVLFLDADERVTEVFARDVRAAVKHSTNCAYWIQYENFFLGRPLKHGVSQRKLALMRVGAGMFERIDDARWSRLDMEVHEHPVIEGQIGAIRSRILHQDFRNLHHFLGRHNDYSTWEAYRYQALLNSDAAWSKLTRRQKLKYKSVTRFWFAPAYFVLTYILKLGFLDGREGLTYAIMKAVYFFEVRLKILELIGQQKGLKPTRLEEETAS